MRVFQSTQQGFVFSKFQAIIRRARSKALRFTLSLFAVMVFGGAAQSALATDACMYQTVNARLQSVDFSTNPATVTPVGDIPASSSKIVNAAGVSPVDGKMYGINQNVPGSHVGDKGIYSYDFKADTFEKVGNAQTQCGSSHNVGTVDENNVLWYYQNNQNVACRFDINTKQHLTPVTLPAAFEGTADVVYSSNDGKFYSVRRVYNSATQVTRLHIVSYDLVSKKGEQTSRLAGTGFNEANGGFGSLILDNAQENMIGFQNSSGNYYSISLATGRVTPLGAASFGKNSFNDSVSYCGAEEITDANDDVVNTDNSEAFVIIDVLANDNFTAGIDVLEILSNPVNTGATAEVVTIDGKQQIKYTLPTDGSSDSFSYKVTDVNGLTDTANVDISIEDVSDDVPVANDDTTDVRNNTTVNADVLANDQIDAAVDKLEITSAPAQGTAEVITVNGSQQIKYTPPSDYVGQDTLTYKVTDVNGESDTADLTINVTSSDFCTATFFGRIICPLPGLLCFLFPSTFCPGPSIDITDVNKDDTTGVLTVTGTVTEGSTVTGQPVDSDGNPTGTAPLDCSVTGTTFSCTGPVDPDDETIEVTAEKDDKEGTDEAPIPATLPPEVEIIGVEKDDVGNATVTGTVTEGSTVTAQPTDSDGNPTNTGPLDCTVTGTTYSCTGPVNPGDDEVLVTAEKNNQTATDDAPIPADPTISLTLDGINRPAVDDPVTLTGTVTEGSNVTATPVTDNGDPTGTAPLSCSVTGTTYECTGVVDENDVRAKVEATRGNLTADPVFADITCTALIQCDDQGDVEPPPRVIINTSKLSEGLFTVAGKVSSDPTSVTAFATPKANGASATECTIAATADVSGLRTYRCIVPVTASQTSVTVQGVRTVGNTTAEGDPASISIR